MCMLTPPAALVLVSTKGRLLPLIAAALWHLTERSVMHWTSAAGSLAICGAIPGLCFCMPPVLGVDGRARLVADSGAAACGAPAVCDSTARSFACVGSASGALGVSSSRTRR